jgi:hypothetical protein
MSARPLSRKQAEKTIAIIEDGRRRGYRLPFEQTSEKGARSALEYAAGKLKLTRATVSHRYTQIKKRFPDLLQEGALFQLERGAEEPTDAAALIETLAARHKKREKAERPLIPVNILEHGPIGIAFIGDPHVDDPGCAWGELRDDVERIADTAGMFAIPIGDYRNNWIGRLTELYADHEVTRKDALVLIEWLFARLGPKMIAAVGGNHDAWHTGGGDPLDFIARLTKLAGEYGAPSYRLGLNLPGCAEQVKVHVRHDFPGQSQFNPAHGLVRETLFGYRDHIMACGDRHHSGYIPYWHNDPRRLCQGIRVGTYKDFDRYAAEKGFRWSNWARSMVAIIDPRYADNPVEFVTVRFSVEAGKRELDARRAEWAASIPADRKARRAPAKAKAKAKAKPAKRPGRAPLTSYAKRSSKPRAR